MISMLFWNINKKNNKNIVVNLARKYKIDVLMLVECLIEPGELLSELNSETSDYYYAPGNCTRIHIYSKFSHEFIKPVFETDRLTIRHLALPAREDILLAVTHFQSKLRLDEAEANQFPECINLASYINKEEHEIGHSRTVLVGDLNMNPFEDGVVAAAGLHGVMSRRIAEKRKRTILTKEYNYFYNPMWSLFGDSPNGPPGTYYYYKAQHIVFFWNIFDQVFAVLHKFAKIDMHRSISVMVGKMSKIDSYQHRGSELRNTAQVLLRPDLLDRFKNEDLQILDSDGSEMFLSESGIPKRDISDHLPLIFKLDI